MWVLHFQSNHFVFVIIKNKKQLKKNYIVGLLMAYSSLMYIPKKKNTHTVLCDIFSGFTVCLRSVCSHTTVHIYPVSHFSLVSQISENVSFKTNILTAWFQSLHPCICALLLFEKDKRHQTLLQFCYDLIILRKCIYSENS